MKAYSKNLNNVLKELNSDVNGLTDNKIRDSKTKYGVNELTKTKNKSIIIRVLEALSEPMLIILELAGIITLGVNIGKTLKNNSGDFYECIGIVFAILVSVILTVVMEGRSQKAFESLTDIYEKSAVKVTRNGSITILPQNQVVVGDIVHLESGDKIVADGRLISSINLEVDESLLTGESKEIRKDSSVILSEKTPLAERINMVYSGTFVTSGSGVMVVTAVGDNAEMGAIASDLKIKNPVSAPLQEKLDRLGKLIASLGLIASVFVLILSVTRLFVQGNVSFDSIEEAFLSSIILIVASVPEGLPTTVAISLTLNVVKLYKSNALIKKLIAAETVGCVSVICSDKTGTLTENKMRVLKVETQTNSLSLSKNLALNFALNTTAEIQNKEVGQATEIALLKYLNEGNLYSYNKLRKEYVVIGRTPFSSENKYMSTTVKVDGESITFFKGAPEIIIGNSTLTEKEKRTALKKILEEQLKGKRVIAFASSNKNQLNNLNYDGFAVIADAVRKDVFASVMECKSAGIKVKMLTGDNYSTAFSIAKELRIAESESEVVNASEIDELSDTELKDIISKITVVARSTPKTKLRIVNALKEMGEVVAVTGDGVNDAPAIKHADIGICMGGGSEVTKEASDIVLLDNSFSTIIKAISFGRNIYQNFQRFIMFQLSVNATAVSFIIISLILGLENPFNTIMLLWINLIMDGPPALTLGLETRGNELMKSSPVKRSNNIVTKKMLVKIAIHAGIMCTLLVLQNSINFIGCKDSEMKTVLFNLFILFQLFNAFNCREFGSKSVFKEIKSNKLMSIVFLVVFILQIMLTELATKFFCTVHLSLVTWIKTILTAFSIIAFSEIYKLIYRKVSKKIKSPKKFIKSFN